MTDQLQIATMRPGEVATIVAIDRDGVDPVTARHLHEMGFDEGVDVEVLHRAPFGGDPIALRVGNSCVALRRRLAAMIVVAPMTAAFLEAAE